MVSFGSSSLFTNCIKGLNMTVRILERSSVTRSALVTCVVIVLALLLSGSSIAQTAGSQRTSAKARAIFAPIDQIGPSLDIWIEKYRDEYDFEVHTEGTDPETRRPIILFMFQLPDVQALFGFYALSEDSELLLLLAENREFLESLDLPFDIDDIDSLEVLGRPDGDHKRDPDAPHPRGDVHLTDSYHDRELAFEHCTDDSCSEMIILIEDDEIIQIVWQWGYG